MLPLGIYFHLLTIIGLVLLRAAYATPLIPSLQPSISNTTTSNRIETCTFQPHWVPNIVRYDDCLRALEVFRQAEGAKSGTQRFEFVAPRAARATVLLPLQTPRKYRHQTCTITVSMLYSFPISFLPPQAKRKLYEPTDVATLNDLKAAAWNVALDCVRNPRVSSRPTVGWTPQGQLHSLGIAVTIWESGSFMDRLIPGGVEFSVNRSRIVDVDVE